ncbi:hypothetical protein GCM10023346_46600 [Arthrobacter gyeryongensis]|uniref:Uncharacterized protein n=1 Tax=Arthrobacter gyeryongensis TaxID=1650592 RepID=A0ABP9SRZ7_9MICC
MLMPDAASPAVISFAGTGAGKWAMWALLKGSRASTCGPLGCDDREVEPDSDDVDEGGGAATAQPTTTEEAQSAINAPNCRTL